MKIFIILTIAFIGIIKVSNAKYNQTEILECYKKAGGAEIVDLAYQHSSQPKVTEWIQCMTKTLEIINPNGSINKENLRQVLITHVTGENRDNILNELINWCAVEEDSFSKTVTRLWYSCLNNLDNVYEHARLKDRSTLVNHICMYDNGGSYKIYPFLYTTPILEDQDFTIFKSYLKCFLLKMGFLKEDGSIEKTVFEKGLLKYFKLTKEVITQIVDQCLEKKDTVEDTAFSIFRCSKKIIK